MLISYSQMTSHPFFTVKTQETKEPKLELSSLSTSPPGAVPGAGSLSHFARLVPHRRLGGESKPPPPVPTMRLTVNTRGFTS